ncbi:zincin-like metallopeptidase toxin domain-containing protein [Myroides odoratus]
MLSKKGDELYQELRTLLNKVIEWIKKNSKRFESTLSKVREAFFKEGKTEEYFRKIEKKFNLAGEQILSTYDLKKLRRLLKETFDVPLELVDQNLKLKGKLKDWTARRVAGSFNMVEGVMYLRKSVTAYTVQHEMFHMKLWYKMTREFPELQPLFQKTLGRENVLFHEEYVLSEFMKDSSKWLEVDLLNDLKNVNKLRKKSNLKEVDLEYYKKWSLEEELLKFE